MSVLHWFAVTPQAFCGICPDGHTKNRSRKQAGALQESGFGETGYTLTATAKQHSLTGYEAIEVLSRQVRLASVNEQDYVCLTDIARYRNPDASDDLIRSWLRNRNTIEFLGIWEHINNPDFNPVEFDGFRKQAGLVPVRTPRPPQPDRHPADEDPRRRGPHAGTDGGEEKEMKKGWVL